MLGSPHLGKVPTAALGCKWYLQYILERSSLSFIKSQEKIDPKGPCTQYLGTWDLGNSNFSIGFG